VSKSVFDRAVDAFIEHTFARALEKGRVYPYEHHIVMVRVNDHYVPLSIHVRWARGQLKIIAHTIVDDERFRELLNRLDEADRKMGEMLPRDRRGRLPIIWGKGGLEAAKAAIRAQWATKRQEYHVERANTNTPEGRAFLAAINNLSLEGKETPVKVYGKRKTEDGVVLWLFTPEARIHTHEGDVLHWGTAPDPSLLKTHPEVVVITRSIRTRDLYKKKLEARPKL